MSTIDEVKSRIDIIDLVSETVQLRHSGKNYTGFCPFHSNTRTPAFVVFPESGTWRCFGQCNEGGDIFKFLMKRENFDFSEALHFLAERAGVQLKPPSPEEKVTEEENDNLRILLEEAVAYYRHQLLNTPAGKQALQYLHEKRGLNDETMEAFGIGYAPNSWDASLNYFSQKGYSPDELFAAGLVTEREPGKILHAEGLKHDEIYDRFRHRIIIPIRDVRGRMAGFGARIMNPEDVPKFLNSPQTAVFDKSRLLYGLDKAKNAIRLKDQAVIVEGYLDVIVLHQAGFSNTVSPMGTALTEQQLNLLKRYSRKFILALDSDAAGDKATLRGLQIARQSMDREQDPVFDARGLIGYESRLKADIRVTTLPMGMDPDEVVKRDPKEWEEIIKNARLIVIHVMETLVANRDITDPKIKNDIALQVMPLISDIPSPIERDTYRQRLARLLQVDESALVQTSGSTSRTRSSQRRSQTGDTIRIASPEAVKTLGGHSLEAHCLGVLVRRPDFLYQVDRLMQQDQLPRLSEADFQDTAHQSIFSVLKESINQDIAEPVNFMFNNLSLPMMELADGLLERTNQLNPQNERVLEDLMRGLLTLRQRALRQEIEYQRYQTLEAQERGDYKAVQLQQAAAHLAEIKRRLDKAISRYSNRATTTRSM